MTGDFFPERAGTEPAFRGLSFLAAAAAPAIKINPIARIDLRWVAVVVFLWFSVWLFFRFIRRIERENATDAIEKAQAVDPAWEEDALLRRMAELFFKFQEAWGHFDIYALKSCATENFYRLLIMEMGSLKRRQRQNFALIPQIRDIRILRAHDEPDNEKDTAVAEIIARMDDVLIDTESGNMLYANYDYFCQYWVFRRENDIWKVDAVRKDTERSLVTEGAIKGFAQRNGFFYDPEFGQVVMPDSGALFRKTNFKKSRVDNHVIGNLCGRTVQFYTYSPGPSKRVRFMSGSDEKRKMLEGLENPYGDASYAALPITASYGSGYVVAQAILSLSYRDVLLRKRRAFLDLAPRGLRRFKGRNDQFNRCFSLFADPQDDVNSFPLATGAFLQKVLELPFDLNIEIVGSFLYLYAKSGFKVSYEKMFDILSAALDEIGSA